MGTPSTGSDGRYKTDSLPPDDYYVLLYNGDDEFLVGFFAEWWMDAPRLRLDQARIVRVAGKDVTGIDARLNPLFLDMFDTIFLDDIAFMQEAGITRGCNPPVNDLYCPDDFVTRGQWRPSSCGLLITPMMAVVTFLSTTTGRHLKPTSTGWARPG